MDTIDEEPEFENFRDRLNPIKYQQAQKLHDYRINQERRRTQMNRQPQAQVGHRGQQGRWNPPRLALQQAPQLPPPLLHTTRPAQDDFHATNDTEQTHDFDFGLPLATDNADEFDRNVPPYPSLNLIVWSPGNTGQQKDIVNILQDNPVSGRDAVIPSTPFSLGGNGIHDDAGSSTRKRRRPADRDHVPSVCDMALIPYLRLIHC